MRYELSPGTLDETNTKALQASKLKARTNGSFAESMLAAGYFAKKTGKTAYVYLGNSFMTSVFRVTDKLSDLNTVNVSNARVYSVASDLKVATHDITNWRSPV